MYSVIVYTYTYRVFYFDVATVEADMTFSSTYKLSVNGKEIIYIFQAVTNYDTPLFANTHMTAKLKNMSPNVIKSYASARDTPQNHSRDNRN